MRRGMASMYFMRLPTIRQRNGDDVSRVGRLLLILLLAFPAIICFPVLRKAIGQAVPLDATVNIGANVNDPKRPFILPSQSSDVLEALDDFDRYSRRKAWERAFKSMETVLEAPPTKLLATREGFLLPTRHCVRRMLAALPSDGREAYRLFYDAQAKDLLARAEGKDELANLETILETYSITSVGDAAGARLGDLYFEQGKTSEAADAWQRVLDEHPDSSLPRVRLLVKAAVALARSDRWDEFGARKREVESRHANENVRLGGREVNAAEYLQSIAQTDEPAAEETPVDRERPIAFPTSNEPLWQFRFFTEQDAAALAAMTRNWGRARMPITEMLPATATDGERIYLNLLGYFMAVDLSNGKLLWRSGRFHGLIEKLKNNVYSFPEFNELLVAEGRLWAIAKPTAKLNNAQEPFYLSCRDPATGDVVWETATNDELKDWFFFGTPVVRQKRVYIAAGQKEKRTELHVFCLGAEDGTVMWKSHVGTYQIDESQMYYRRSAAPSLLLTGERLLVETNGGAVVQLNADDGALEWGFAYDSSAPETNQWNSSTVPESPGTLLTRDNVLYVKGMRSDRLYAVELNGPTKLWERPISQSAGAISVDDDGLLLGGPEGGGGGIWELNMIDLASRELKWVERVPVGTSWTVPLATQRRVYQFTPRGVFQIDKSNGVRVGRVFRGADLSSLGGRIIVTPKRLITVSNLTVTGYAIDNAPAADPSAAAAVPLLPTGAIQP